MIRASLASLALLSTTAMATPAFAAPDDLLPIEPLTALATQPVLTGDARYTAIFAALDGQRWADAKAQIAALGEGDVIRPFALAQLYLAKNSPRVELFDLLELVNKASWLPQADQLSRLAQKRGAQILPTLPQVQKLVWLGAAPRREYVASVKTDLVAQALGTKVIPLIKADNPAAAEYEITAVEPMLTPEGRTEWRQRVAWSYYIENDDANARRLATIALSDNIGGDWAVQAHWTIGLAAWRQNDCRAAAPSFANVAALAGNTDMRAAGAYWAARAYMNCGEPAKVANLLKTAAKADETFYGMLARETLGIAQNVAMTAVGNNGLPSVLKDVPNAQAAVTFAKIGRDDMADMAIRYQARLGGNAQYDALLKLAGALNLPATQLWLAHNGPAGQQPATSARFPAPNWKPGGGWRVDPALVFAHTLQESGFRADAVSSAGAHGLMQVRTGTAGDVAGGNVTTAQLHTPSINMEYGQRYLEQLRDMPATGGLLPKVMAAYNAGPTPVERWNYQVKDGGDPLLFIESLPYYETRAYVNIVMRNYWVYQLQAKGSADCMTGMAQGMWPRFPSTKGTTLVRLGAGGKVASAY
ncbi:lytic murein transglycosylase [Sphingobium sp. SCG-1]|uniref:lytic transglycosylase domain-containing protein n=1 Tax=Sphingobium sp. SCG-1 TaxID=2072936 RepID=UPI000CD6C1D7|nr:lytic transglycosylase domain-containing protein [Sphingobium sp. SCG-1]AUW58535.1 lytic murein transglycosylase [Sphingobium sp. SCG-1]